MGTTSRDRQRAHRERLRAEGKKQLLVTLSGSAQKRLDAICTKEPDCTSSDGVEIALWESEAYRREQKPKPASKKKQAVSDHSKAVDDGDNKKKEFAMAYARMAVAQLRSICDGHSDRQESIDYIKGWIEEYLVRKGPK